MAVKKATKTKWYQNKGLKLILPLLFIGVFSIGGAKYLQASHAASVCKSTTFTQGSSGNCVTFIQYMLNRTYKDIGYTGGAFLGTDGKYGSLTKAQVIAYQTWVSKSLPVPQKLTLDGKVGPKTWIQLCADGGTSLRAPYDSAIDRLGYLAAINSGC